jgi:GNAT superfamily N-acetyltransferase
VKLQSLTDAAAVSRVYDDVLVPSFPMSELVTRDWVLDGVGDGTVTVVAAYEGEIPMAAAVTEVLSPGVMLLSYLATLPASRGSGIGSRLLDRVRQQVRRTGVGLLLAEVERPDRHAGSAEHGDPTARLRFYARQGAVVLDLPYVQPPARPGAEPVPGMLLLALEIAPSLLRDAGGSIDGAVVARALDAIMGEERDDGPREAALRAAARRPAVPLRHTEEWAAVEDSSTAPE